MTSARLGKDPRTLAPREHQLLRRAFELADTALARGERPFGAVIADATGTIMAAAHGHGIGSGDVTAHAEVTAIRELPRDIGSDLLVGCTLYSSVEPCAMCAGAIYWSNIGRVVYGVSEERLRALRNVGGHVSALTMKCAAVLATGGHAVEVVGPMLEDEAIRPHLQFWSRPSAAICRVG
jgi:tRNA(Arg) A34 adenosine deaminase TadA